MFENKENGAKYIQLYNYYKNLIISGVMSSGEKMPSIRKCSQSFELSRTTVETAYEMLAAEGYVISKAQSGFYVCSVDFTPLQFSKQTESAGHDESLIKYDLVSSSGDKSSFNFSLWRRYVKSALRQDERLLSYGEPQGEYDLREAICAYAGKERGVVSSPSQIVVAAGTQNLIGILSAITKERKNVVFVGSRFEQGKAVFEDYGKTVSAMIGVPDKISDLKSLVPSIIYTSPSHIDNWGGVLPSGKRIEILNFAKENDCLIIEDDYDSEFRYYSRPVPSLQGMNGGQNVVYIGTFSKLLLPSIRISFMVLPQSLANIYKERGKLYNQTASKAEQIALCQYIRDGHLAAQIRKQKKQYVSKTKFICKRASEILPKEFEFKECQTSYLIRVTVKTEMSEFEFAKRCEKNGIKLKPVGYENEKALLLVSVAGFSLDDCDDMLLRLGKTLSL